MSKDNTLLYVGLAVAGVYLLRRNQSALPVPVNTYHPPVTQTPVSQVSQLGLLLPIVQKLFGNSAPTATPITSTDFSNPGSAENVSDSSEANYWLSQVPVANSSAPSSGSGNLVLSNSSSPTGFDLGNDPFEDETFL